MPASTIVASGGSFRLYGNAVQTFDTLPVATYAIAFNSMSGYSLRETRGVWIGPAEQPHGRARYVRRIRRGNVDHFAARQRKFMHQRRMGCHLEENATRSQALDDRVRVLDGHSNLPGVRHARIATDAG